MRRRAPIIALVSAVCAPVSIAAAQTVSGTVSYAESNTPLGGAIVSVLSGTRDTVAVTLSREDGRFYLRIPARRELTLLVRAIGREPVRKAFGPLASAADTVLMVEMRAIAIRLDAIRVQEFSECARSQTGTHDIVHVWREVTKALENAKLVRDVQRRQFDIVVYERITDVASGRHANLRMDTLRRETVRPFATVSPKELASKGYILEESTRVPFGRVMARAEVYRAPDEAVLLDKSFETGHCFWATAGNADNAGMIGIHFIPLTASKVNDIRGVIWVDSTSYELRRVDYRYTQVHTSPQPVRPGAKSLPSIPPPEAAEPSPLADSPGYSGPRGEIEFDRLPDGAFIVRRWRLFINDTWRRRAPANDPFVPPKMIREAGGLITQISSGGG